MLGCDAAGLKVSLGCGLGKFIELDRRATQEQRRRGLSGPKAHGARAGGPKLEPKAHTAGAEAKGGGSQGVECASPGITAAERKRAWGREHLSEHCFAKRHSACAASHAQMSHSDH